MILTCVELQVVRRMQEVACDGVNGDNGVVVTVSVVRVSSQIERKSSRRFRLSEGAQRVETRGGEKKTTSGDTVVGRSPRGDRR